MIVIDYHCDYSHNWRVRSCELGLELGALSAFVKWKYSSSDVTLMLLFPVLLTLGDTARTIHRPNCRME